MARRQKRLTTKKMLRRLNTEDVKEAEDAKEAEDSKEVEDAEEVNKNEKKKKA